MSINKVVILGNLTKDVDLRKTPNGTSVASFTVALNRFGANEGEQQADYIQCVAWNKTADNLDLYCGKGSKVGIVGRLQSRTYEGKNGKVYVTEVLCEQVEFLNTKSKEEPKKETKHDDPFIDLDIQF